jgi:hypothetical protein
VPTDETELEMVKRHVAAGRLMLERQRHILADMAVCGHPTEMARNLLAIMESIQQMHEEHLSRITRSN